MKCNRCGKENPAEIHTCTPKALVLADQLEDAESARLHLLPYAAAELRRLHDENEALKAAQYECGFGAGCCYQAAKSEADEVLLRQVLEDICGAKLCEVNSMSSRAEARRLLDKATNALRVRLGETGTGIFQHQTEKDT